MALTFISANDYANQISNETIHNGSYWRISNLWHKGDYSLLYAEDRKEATAAAFAMAANVSPGLAKTLFVSFPQNLRDIQPQLRGNENVQIFIPTTNIEEDFAETLIDNLRTAIKDHGFDTIVIDNLNRISALSTGRNAALTQLVNSLFALHVETDATLLITAYNLSKSTRFRLAALTDTTFTAETVQEEGIYRTQKSCILTNALRPDNLASQNNLINSPEFQVPCPNNSTNNNPSDLSERSDLSDDTHSQEHTPQLTKVDDDLYIDFTDSNIPRAERRRALRAYRKLQSKELTQNP